MHLEGPHLGPAQRQHTLANHVQGASTQGHNDRKAGDGLQWGHRARRRQQSWRPGVSLQLGLCVCVCVCMSVHVCVFTLVKEGSTVGSVWSSTASVSLPAHMAPHHQPV